jgi:hypothetical protein
VDELVVDPLLPERTLLLVCVTVSVASPLLACPVFAVVAVGAAGPLGEGAAVEAESVHRPLG